MRFKFFQDLFCYLVWFKCFFFLDMFNVIVNLLMLAFFDSLKMELIWDLFFGSSVCWMPMRHSDITMTITKSCMSNFMFEKLLSKLPHNKLVVWLTKTRCFFWISLFVTPKNQFQEHPLRHLGRCLTQNTEFLQVVQARFFVFFYVSVSLDQTVADGYSRTIGQDIIISWKKMRSVVT